VSTHFPVQQIDPVSLAFLRYFIATLCLWLTSVLAGILLANCRPASEARPDAPLDELSLNRSSLA